MHSAKSYATATTTIIIKANEQQNVHENQPQTTLTRWQSAASHSVGRCQAISLYNTIAISLCAIAMQSRDACTRATTHKSRCKPHATVCVYVCVCFGVAN